MSYLRTGRITRVAVIITFLSLGIFAFSGCGGNEQKTEETQEADQVSIRIPIVDSRSSPKFKAFERFADNLDDEMPGHFNVEIFPGGQLGGESDYLSGIRTGSYEMTSVSAGVLSSFSPQVRVLDIPFAFSSFEEARSVIDGKPGRMLLESIDDQNTLGLAFWEQGFRSVTTTNRILEDPGDLQGLKIRTMNAPMHVDAFRAIGANPTPMEWPQVYTALKTGQLDAQENPPAAIWQENINEVQNHIFVTKHIYGVMPVVARKNWYESLDSDEQQAVEKALDEATEYERSLTRKREQKGLRKLEELGMTVHRMEPAVLDSLRETAQSAVLSEIRDRMSELGDEEKKVVRVWLDRFGERRVKTAGQR